MALLQGEKTMLGGPKYELGKILASGDGPEKLEWLMLVLFANRL